jgi:cytidylate kinase
MSNVVTLSASYGAHGDMIGRAVADRLVLPFLDRAIPASVAKAITLPSPEMAESLDEPTPSRWDRFVSAMANTPNLAGPDSLRAEKFDTPEDFRAAAERRLQELADTTGAVVLGRGGMVVLAGRPDVLCVRLDGPVEDRISQVVALGIDEKDARQGQRDVDRAREAYVKVFFNARQGDSSLYHLILDSTALSVEACVDIIERAALDRFDSRH